MSKRGDLYREALSVEQSIPEWIRIVNRYGTVMVIRTSTIAAVAWKPLADQEIREPGWVIRSDDARIPVRENAAVVVMKTIGVPDELIEDLRKAADFSRSLEPLPAAGEKKGEAPAQ